MRASNIIVIGLAAVFGILSIFAGRAWLSRQADAKARQLEAAAHRAPVSTRKIVVAGAPLRFGVKLEPAMLREIDWPAGEMPAGAFASIPEVFEKAGDRVILTAVEPNEPLLGAKITAPGERATLSRLLRPGMKAVTIQANAVAGVGGFVNPGDHVDIVLTRPPVENGPPPAADVVLQNVRVLAVDQSADERKFKATVAQTVTLEVPMREAQRIVLSASVGTLSLLLRSAGDMESADPSRVSLTDLGLAAPPAPVEPAPASQPRSVQPAPAAAPPAAQPGWSLASMFGGPGATQKPEKRTVSVNVARGTEIKEYRVPSLAGQPDGKPRLAAAE